RGFAVCGAAWLVSNCSLTNSLDDTRGGAHADAGEAGVDGGCGPIPWLCAAASAECGLITDATCGEIDCGQCPPGLTCSGSGAKNQCGCEPKTCEDLGYTCGTWSDGCGGLIACGSCISPKLCNAAGACATCTEGTPCAPSKPCIRSSMECTGTPKCVDSSYEPGGTSCGPGLICDGAGNCACTPKTCSELGLECGSGNDGCGGTVTCPTCATGKVCDQSGKCTDCLEGAACQASNACKTASMDCSSGGGVCTDDGNAPSGTSCGVGQKCDGQGACKCAAKSCADLGKECGTWSDGCGGNVTCTACATNKVCDPNGKCVDCAQGASCAASKVCATATVDCSGGAPSCKDTGLSPPGISCGQGMVCDGLGTCKVCAQGQSCAPSNPCKLGFTECSSGSPVCVESGNVGNGTSCGPNSVCNNGSCGSCTSGTTCSPSSPCKNGATSCSSGSSVCNETTNKANGTPCGTGKVCNGGNCASCSSGGSCQPANECKTGSYSCATGTQVCGETGNKANGTTCTSIGGCTTQCQSGNCQTIVGWVYDSGGGSCGAAAYYCKPSGAPPPPSGYFQSPTPVGCDYHECTGNACQINYCMPCPGGDCGLCLQ
ncbi:MAG TPA: hypothetical protein PKD61_19340, partial [Polyangiaceae bacterium]|nr:hypothetical protein [Polyangiaceae bacterium]